MVVPSVTIQRVHFLCSKSLHTFSLYCGFTDDRSFQVPIFILLTFIVSQHNHEISGLTLPPVLLCNDKKTYYCIIC